MKIALPGKDLSRPLHLVIDSTGAKVYGEGEWKVRRHSVGKGRTWRKLHLCVNEATLEIVSEVASTNDVSDGEAPLDLLQDVPVEIEQISAAGAHDQRRCYDALNKHGAKAAIPPRKGAKIWRNANAKAEGPVRDENLRRIRKVGRKERTRESHYNRRRLAETTVFRFKTIYGQSSRGMNETCARVPRILRVDAWGRCENYCVLGSDARSSHCEEARMAFHDSETA